MEQQQPNARQGFPITDQPPASNGAGTAVLDPPTEAAVEPALSTGQWAQEKVQYLFDPETRELCGADVRIAYNDGYQGQTYTATIRRDSGNTWAWHEGTRFLGSHQSDFTTLLNRVLHQARRTVLGGVIT